MFTGIIDHTGQVLELRPSAKSFRLKISTQFDELSLGESIAVEGVCLTVAQIDGQAFEVDISTETLELTHLSQLEVGQVLNLERSLRLNDRLGGHTVMGHVDQVAEIKHIHEIEGAWEVEVSGVRPEFQPYLIPKGSVTVNGVSLTLNEITDSGFKLMLIPHTLAITSLKALKAASSVNLEFDIFTKTVFKQLSYLVRDFYVKA